MRLTCKPQGRCTTRSSGNPHNTVPRIMRSATPYSPEKAAREWSAYADRAVRGSRPPSTMSRPRTPANRFRIRRRDGSGGAIEPQGLLLAPDLEDVPHTQGPRGRRCGRLRGPDLRGGYRGRVRQTALLRTGPLSGSRENGSGCAKASLRSRWREWISGWTRSSKPTS